MWHTYQYGCVFSTIPGIVWSLHMPYYLRGYFGKALKLSKWTIGWHMRMNMILMISKRRKHRPLQLQMFQKIFGICWVAYPRVNILYFISLLNAALGCQNGKIKLRLGIVQRFQESWSLPVAQWPTYWSLTASCFKYPNFAPTITHTHQMNIPHNG